MLHPRRLLVAMLLLLVALALSAAGPPPEALGSADAAIEMPTTRGTVVVANRADGTLSAIDAATNLVRTIPLPAGSEPMYVVYVKHMDLIFVGDRANNRVLVLDGRDFMLKGSVAAGNGVFHMWAHPNGDQLWVSNDIDNTMSVIDTRSLASIATVALPGDLVAMGGKPHDVILDRESAYVTMLGLPGPTDVVVKYDRSSFAEVARADVGKDPHVMLDENRRRLYVAAQNSSLVSVLDRHDLSEITTIAVPGAHGVWIPHSGRVMYVTNLPGGGTDGLFTIDLRTNSLVGGGVDTAYGVPHNLVASDNGRRLYVTHSGGTSDKVTVYAISRQHPTPVAVGEVTVGLNPFGLAWVPARGN